MSHFKDRLILGARNVEQVAKHTRKLRLQITKQECSQVLDASAQRASVGLTIKQIDQVANHLVPNWFIEPK